MVLFHEKKTAPTPAARRRRRIFWLIAVIAGLVCLSLLMLSALGGAREPLKKGLEDYLTTASGMKARIGRFEYMKFYPDVRVAAGRLGFVHEGETDEAVSLGSLALSMNFWDLVLSQRRLQELTIKDLDVRKGEWAPQEFKSVSLSISGGEMPEAVLTGLYGADAFTGRMKMERGTSIMGRPYFTRPEFGAFTFSSPALKVDEGALSRADDGGMQLDFTKAELYGRPAQGRLLLLKSGDRLQVRVLVAFKDAATRPAVFLSPGIPARVFGSSEKQALSCLFSRLDLEDGKPAQSTMAASYGTRTLAGGGAVSLRAGTVDLRLAARPESPSGALLVKGPWNQPELSGASPEKEKSTPDLDRDDRDFIGGFLKDSTLKGSDSCHQLIEAPSK